MNTISIKDFKGFTEPLKFELGGKNMMVCGENGSGKSSLYDALSWVFYHQKIIDNATPSSAVTPAAKEGVARTERNRYNNKKTMRELSIEVDGSDYTVYPYNDYKAFFVDSSKLIFNDSIQIEKMIDINRWPIDNLDTFMSEHRELIATSVNADLKKYHEDATIQISATSPYIVTINETERGLTASNELHLCYNEAKLHIISVSILLAMIDIASQNDKNFVVIDDVVSSMDGANRTIFANSILNEFKPEKYQLVVLTHNVTFRNLFKYIVNNASHYHKSENWIYYSMYEVNKVTKCYKIDEKSNVQALRDMLEKPSDNSYTPDKLGNIYRTKLEELIHTLCELLMVGAKEDTKNLLSILENNTVFYKQGMKGEIAAVGDLESIINKTCVCGLKNVLRKRIADRKIENNHLKYLVKEANLYKKLLLHPLSHLDGEVATYTTKELRMCLTVMQKLEDTINKLKEPVDISSI